MELTTKEGSPGKGRQGRARRGGGGEGAFVTVVAGWDVDRGDGDVSKVQGYNGPAGGDAPPLIHLLPPPGLGVPGSLSH